MVEHTTDRESILHHYRLLLTISGGVVGMLALVIVLLVLNKPLLPASVTKQAQFTVSYPVAQSGLQPERSTAAYSKPNAAISYDVLVNGIKVAVSEQVTPDVFSQSGVYDFKIQQANGYNSFDTSAGQVDLTKPKELNGHTLAWLNNKGTLLLARAYGNLSENQWKFLFNNLKVVH
jgi:hypothetical protein